MRLKRIIGSHVANLQEQWECNRLVDLGMVAPVLTELYPLQDIGRAVRHVQLNQHTGKVGVLCLAPRPGLGVTDAARRAASRPERYSALDDGVDSTRHSSAAGHDASGGAIFP